MEGNWGSAKPWMAALCNSSVSSSAILSRPPDVILISVFVSTPTIADQSPTFCFFDAP